ncbi:ATP-binding protein [Nonomuraea sp. NPDC002799]
MNEDHDEFEDVRGVLQALERIRRERGTSYRQLAEQINKLNPDRRMAPSSLHHMLIKGRRIEQLDLRLIAGALGEDPGSWAARLRVVRSRRMNQLSQRYAPVPAVAQLPYDIRQFTGRREEVARLRGWLGGPDGGTGMPLAVIEGMAGVGKTKLAVHVAHLERARFDDAQLFVDLCGFAPDREPAAPSAVLESFLRLLGVPNAQIPAGLEERAALYRARLDRRKVMVVLDNAANEEQVRPLLPGSADNAVIVTTRRALPGLDGAGSLALAPLDAGEAVELLDEMVGEGRVLAEPKSAHRIAELCGGLPLALMLAGRKLKGRPTWRFSVLIDRLEGAGQRLSELSVSDRSLRAMFGLSYAQLGEEHRRMFRLLASHPGHDFCAYSAAALADLPRQESVKILEDLLDEHLLEETSPERYRFHDLLRAFAGERLAEEVDPHARDAAVRRVLDWYVRTADRADRLLDPHRRHIVQASDEGVEPHPLETYEQALSWCDIERPNLAAAIRMSAQSGRYRVTWQLPTILFSYDRIRNSWREVREAQRLALTAAEEISDLAAQAWILNGLGIAHTELGDRAWALDCFLRALALRRQLGDRPGEADSLNNLGEFYRRTGDCARALECYLGDLHICRELDDRHGQAVSLNNIGKVKLRMRFAVEAFESHRLALSLCQEVGDAHAEAEILHDLGETCEELERLEDAVSFYSRAAGKYQTLGDLFGSVQALCSLAVATSRAEGGGDAVRRVIATAESLVGRVEEPAAEQLRQRLEHIRLSYER